MLVKGNHNTVLCRKRKSNDKYSLVTTNENFVLLQTAVGFITDVKEKEELEIRIVFDSCSQQTYITEKVARKLNLTPSRELKIYIKPFGKDIEEIITAKEYCVCIKPIERDRAIYVNAIAIPIICSPVSNKKTKIAINKHPFLKKLKLADKVSSRCSEEIEMLIGADIYWKLVSNKTMTLD